jgi:HAD superfamily hydrolase (TIGR01662 family)
VIFRNGAVFLDRDGVLNEAVIKDGKPFPPASAEELVIVPDARESLEELRARGFRLIVVTNQPDVRRGKTTQGAVEKINQLVREALPIDAFETCYHDDSDRAARGHRASGEFHDRGSLAGHRGRSQRRLSDNSPRYGVFRAFALETGLQRRYVA